jgi:hypothetical protein
VSARFAGDAEDVVVVGAGDGDGDGDGGNCISGCVVACGSGDNSAGQFVLWRPLFNKKFLYKTR